MGTLCRGGLEPRLGSRDESRGWKPFPRLSLTALEVGQVPRHPRWIEINIPEGISRECLDPDSLPGWGKDDCIASRSFGGTWLEQGRTAALVVPSIVTRREQNLLINSAHPDFCRMLASRPLPVEWDQRLFARAD